MADSPDALAPAPGPDHGRTFRALAGAAPVGIFHADADGRCLYTNERWCEITGLSADEALGDGWARALHPDDRERVQAEWARCAREKAGFALEYRYRAPDGRVTWVFGQARVLPGPPGGWVGALTDITDRKHTEDLAGDRERQLTTLMANLPGVAYRCLNDRDWTMLFASAGSEPLLGCTPEDMVSGRVKFGDLVMEEDRPGVWETVQSCLGARRPFTLIYRIRALTGEVKWVWEQGEGVFSEDGECQFLEGFVTDITRQKEAEALEAAKALAEQASRAKSEFLSRMSHDLRTPLNAVLGFAQLLKAELEEGAPTVHGGAVNEILSAGRHLLDLINEVLDLSSIDAGRARLRIEAVSPCALVAECVAMVRHLAEQRRVTVVACPPELETPDVLADPTRLKQVLMNLLTNAVKYNRPGGRVEISVVPAGNGHLRIQVADTGPGIPPECQAEVFEPFHRLPQDAGRVEGSGLGLAIAKHLVENMGGAIGLVSESGTGCRFAVELVAAPDGPGAPVPPDPEEAGLATGERAGGTVLYIEDNPANQELVRQLMRRRPGVRLVCATLGGDGLAAAHAQAPDLILLDLQLPDMDGLEVARRLRAEADTRAIPIVAVSAHSAPGDIDRGLAEGLDGYLTKPVRLDDLLREVDIRLAYPGTRPPGTG
jgi:PAS domain S-box-containing protein